MGGFPRRAQFSTLLRMEAPFGTTQWSDFLSRQLGRPVQVRFGRARRQVIVVEGTRSEGALRVRMNELFSEAPEDVRQATADWLRAGRRARRSCRLLDEWIASMEARFRSRSNRRTRLRLEGEHYHLGLLLEELLESEFPGELATTPGVTWGRRGRARRSLQLGSYDPSEHLIRLHPVLDQPGVPRFFVRYVLFHELLHAALPRERRNGRDLHHGPLFRAREEGYEDYESALDWQERHLKRLMHSARTGAPLRVAVAGRLAGMVQGWLFPEQELRGQRTP